MSVATKIFRSKSRFGAHEQIATVHGVPTCPLHAVGQRHTQATKRSLDMRSASSGSRRHQSCCDMISTAIAPR